MFGLDFDMISRRSEYLRATGAGIVAKFLSMTAGLFSLWLINRLLDKDQFGAYAFTMAVMGLVITFAPAGLDHSVLYRLSRFKQHRNRLAGGPQVRWVLRMVVGSSVALAFLTVVSANLLSPHSSIPDLASWFLMLGALIPLQAIDSVYRFWHQAQGQVHKSLVIPRLYEVAKALLFLLAWALYPTPGGVAAAVVLAAAIPVVVWFLSVPLDTYGRPKRLPRGDPSYGFNMTLTSAAEIGVRRADLVMIGILTTAFLAADYALAARLVALTTLGNELLGAVFTPRMARYLEQDDYSGLSEEYDLTRSLVVSLGLATGAFFSVFGDQILLLFGDFVNARPVLLILCAAFIVKIGFGASGRYLNMAGWAAWNLTMTIFLLVAMILINLVLIPQFGATGAAFGTLASFFMVSALQSIVIWKKDRFPTMRVETSLILTAAVALLLLTAFTRSASWLSGLGLLMLSLISGRSGWPIGRRLIMSWRQR